MNKRRRFKAKRRRRQVKRINYFVRRGYQVLTESDVRQMMERYLYAI